MTTYSGVYEFNDRGILAFKKIFLGGLEEGAIDPTDRQFTSRVQGTLSISDGPAETDRKSVV